MLSRGMRRAVATDMNPTIPAPVESLRGAFVPGTIGFDMYVAVLGVSRLALRPARLPS